MNRVEGSSPSAGLLRFLRDTAGLREKLEASLRARPLATAGAVAGVAFLAGTILGSRFLRAVVVASVPAVVQRVLDGPLGDQLQAYFRGSGGGPSSSHLS